MRAPAASQPRRPAHAVKGKRPLAVAFRRPLTARDGAASLWQRTPRPFPVGEGKLARDLLQRVTGAPQT